MSIVLVCIKNLFKNLKHRLALNEPLTVAVASVSPAEKNGRYMDADIPSSCSRNGVRINMTKR